MASGRPREGGASIRTKMLVIIVPLIVVPMLILGAVGFVTSSREAAKTSSRYLLQRETDLRALAENPGIPNYFANTLYGLVEEAEIARRELELSLKRFAERSNSIEPIYRLVRYVDAEGREVAKVAGARIVDDRGDVSEEPFFAAIARSRPGEVYLSPVAETMVLAMPVHHTGGARRAPILQGAVVLDFVYPLAEFQRGTWLVLRTFAAITAVTLGVALCLIIIRVRRLTDPIRKLAEAAHLIAGGQRAVAVQLDSRDEIGRLASAFNEMVASLDANEAALQRKVEETRTLYEIGQEITARVALQPTLNLIVDRARELLRADVGRLALRDESGDEFSVQAHSGAVTAAQHRGLRFRPGEGVVGRVVATGEPVVTGDYRDEFPDSPFLEVIQETGLRAYVAVPLKAHGAVIGVLYVISRTPHKFREGDLQLLSALADQAAIAIENARLFEQARRHAEELEAKVEMRTRELQEANRRLEEASRHKSEFLANMSHELRTPLNAIIGFTRLVMRRSKESLPAKQYENLEKILVSADHLLALINDILDLSKIEAGRMEVRPVDFDLAPLIDECLRTVEPMVRSERLRLDKDLEAGIGPLHTDRDKLKQILINLLSNAVKFTDAGTVTVTARSGEGRLAIGVDDTGIGIPADALQVIFEEFRQLDRGPTRRYGGTGLGLSISRHFARLLGGEVTVASAVGVGSTFTVTIPPRLGGAAESVRPAAAPAAEGEARQGGGRIVLAIDDDPNAIYLLRENLGEAGYRVVGALTAEDGLDKARSLRPFAITLDILMPVRDGWDVLRDLKADALTRDIPVIVVSITDNKDQAYRLGAFDYMLKPFDREAVLAALARIGRGAGRRLLVVDDDPRVADLVRQLLEGEPYEVRAAGGGEEALRAISRDRPDIVLLDLLMPGMDGFAVLDALQQSAETRLIPVVVLTAKDLSGAERAMLDRRVAKVVQKSGLDRDAFIADLRGALAAYGNGRAGS